MTMIGRCIYMQTRIAHTSSGGGRFYDYCELKKKKCNVNRCRLEEIRVENKGADKAKIRKNK